MNTRPLSALALTIAACSTAFGQCNSNFGFTDFTGNGGDVGRLTMVGNSLFTGGVLRLTPEFDNQAGAAWFTASRNEVGNGFTTSFAFRITAGTADGLAFVIQNQAPNVIGTGGGGLGYAGITRSVAVEFDTFSQGAELGEPHVSVQSRGNAPNESVDAASIQNALVPFELNDDVPHSVVITYVPRLLTINMDGGAFVMNVVLDLHDIFGADILDPGNQCAWVGFTAGSGAASARQDILNWDFNDGSGCVGAQFTETPGVAPRRALERAEFRMASSGTGPFSYVWQRGGIDIVDDGRITGATTGTLVIDPIRSSDAGMITYKISNACSAITGQFDLIVQCYADFNDDGGIDGSDVDAFFGQWENGQQSADVNQDGGVDGSDVQTFFLAWEAGACE